MRPSHYYSQACLLFPCSRDAVGDDDGDEEAPPANFVSANPTGRRDCREWNYGYL